jgi:glycerol-3-phosphate acyltransferase PlsY
MLVGFAAIVGHNWPVYLNFHGGRGFSPFLGVLLVLFPWGVLIILAGLAIGKVLGSPAIPLLVVMSLPIASPSLNGSPVVPWLSAGMTVITIVKRLEANRRPLPADPIERRNVILRRIFLDRDIQDHKSWIQRGPHQHN